MQNQIEQLLNETKGTFGVAIKHLEKEEELLVNGHTLFPLASVFKIPILVTLFKEVVSNRIQLSDRVQLSKSDRVPGSGVLKELDEGTNVSVKDLATLMIIISDNMATDKLLQLIGVETVQEYMKELGLENLDIHHSCWDLLSLSVGKYPEPYTTERYEYYTNLLNAGKFDYDSIVFQEVKGNNVSTVKEMNNLLEIIVRNDGLLQKSSKEILDILFRQQLRQRIPSQLPEGTKVAHKTGTIGGTVNDSGIIYLPYQKGTVLITVLSKGNSTMDEGARVIGKIARLAYDHYTR